MGETQRLQRPGLAARLVQALDDGGLVLVAPAGYGKTIALGAALDQRGGAVAWIRCNPSDADPGHLLRRTLTAVGDAAPGVADPIAARVAAAAVPVDPLAGARDLGAELERLVLDRLTIAFDDAEHLSRESAAIVALLLAVRNPHLRVAVCSRRALPAPLARLRTAGAVTEVDAAALAFGPDECAALLGDERAHESEAVYEATEGWPLGIAVAAAGRAPSGPLRTRDALFGYLAEEVFRPLEPSERRAVLASALPRELDARALDALELGQDFPHTAAARGLLMRAADPPAYHPLFRDFLLEQLNGDLDTRDLHARLGAALDGGDAVEHWLAAERWDDAAAAIEQAGTALLPVAPATVGRWIDALPDAQRRRAGIAFLKGRLVYGAGRLTDAQPSLAAAVQAARDAGDLQMEWVARYALADTLYLLRRYDAVGDVIEGFDEGEATGAFAAPLAAIAGAAALARGSCDFDGSLALFRRATAHPLGTAYAQQERAFQGFYFDFPQGRLDDALANVHYGIELGERHGDPGQRLPFLWGFVAMIREERGEDAEALEAVERAQGTAGDKRGYLQQFAHAFRAGLCARSGRPVQAEAELRGIDTVTGDGFFSGDVEVTKATIAIKRGDAGAAASLAEEAIANGALATWHERARNTAHLVPVLVEAGRAGRARELLDEALAARPPLCSTARLRGLLAWLDERDGAVDRATSGLAAALEEAGSQAGHLLRREWPRLRTLLEATVDAGAVDPDRALGALEGAFPGTDVLIPFTHAPAAATRRAAVSALAASGNPAAARRVADLAADPDSEVACCAGAAAERAAQSPPPLLFGLFGGFTLRRGLWVAPDTEWGRRAAARLVRVLLVTEDAVSEDILLEALFPGQKQASARRGLQVAVSAARRVLDLPGAAASALEARDHTYRLHLRPGIDVVDTHEFEAAARAALSGDDVHALEAAAAVWHGDPLPEDRYEPWAIGWRERLLDLRGQLLGRLADRRAESGDAAGAIAAARELVAIDPLAESAHRRLMTTYARAGRRADALRQYLECRRLLVDELGVEPDAQTRRVHATVLAGDPL